MITNNQRQRMTTVKRWYDAKCQLLLLEGGDWVLLSVHAYPRLEGLRKHQDRYVGPSLVSERVHDNAYKLRGLPPSIPRMQNVQYLKLFCPPPLRFQGWPHVAFAEPQQIGDQVEWEVAEIVGHKALRRGMRYRVRWKDTNQLQWLREESMSNCRELLQEYHQAQKWN